MKVVPLEVHNIRNKQTNKISIKKILNLIKELCRNGKNST